MPVKLFPVKLFNYNGEVPSESIEMTKRQSSSDESPTCLVMDSTEYSLESHSTSEPHRAKLDDYDAEKSNFCSRLRNKVINIINSRAFRVLMAVTAILNLVQLIVFFVVGVLYIPRRTRMNLLTHDIYFMMNHVADNYIDYDFFIDESVL